MNMSPFVILTSVAALAAAAASGMMYVFSTFVMRGLDRTGPVEAITAMRGINVVANSSPAFLLAYFGATILALVVGVIAVIQIGQPGSVWILVGAVFGILAAIITMAFNVPLNNHLDTVNPVGLVRRRRDPGVAGVLLDVDGVESPPRGHQHHRGVFDFVRPDDTAEAAQRQRAERSARRCEPAGA